MIMTVRVADSALSNIDYGFTYSIHEISYWISLISIHVTTGKLIVFLLLV